jgi:hypothetical protein
MSFHIDASQAQAFNPGGAVATAGGFVSLEMPGQSTGGVAVQQVLNRREAINAITSIVASHDGSARQEKSPAPAKTETSSKEKPRAKTAGPSAPAPKGSAAVAQNSAKLDALGLKSSRRVYDRVCGFRPRGQYEILNRPQPSAKKPTLTEIFQKAQKIPAARNLLAGTINAGTKSVLEMKMPRRRVMKFALHAGSIPALIM